MPLKIYVSHPNNPSASPQLDDDIPDNQTLSSSTITSCKYTRLGRRITAQRRLDVLATITLKFANCLVLGSQKAHRQQHHIGREKLFRSLNLLHVPSTTCTALPFHADSVDSNNIALIITNKFLGKNAVLAGITPVLGLNLRMSVIYAEDLRPLRPGIVPGTNRGRCREQLKVNDRLRAVTNCGSDAVVSGISTSNNNNILVLGEIYLPS